MKQSHLYPILILHGWGLSGKKYQKLSALLEKDGYTVFAPNFSGFDAKHELVRAYTLHDYSQELLSYMQVNKISKAHVIAHSFGGRVALVLHSQHPEYFQKVVLSGVPGFRAVTWKRYGVSMLGAKLGNVVLSLLPIPEFKERVRAWYYSRVGARDYTRAKGFLRETFKNVVVYDLSDHVRRFDATTLLLWGENDMVVPEFVARHMERAMPHAQLHFVQNAGHNILIDDPKLAYSHIVSFLTTVP